MNFKKLVTMAKNKKIYHRNDARSSLISMGLSARRILYLTIVQQSKDDDGVIIFDKDRVYTITAKDYADLCNIDPSVAYKQLKEGVEEISSHLMMNSTIRSFVTRWNEKKAKRWSFVIHVS